MSGNGRLDGGPVSRCSLSVSRASQSDGCKQNLSWLESSCRLYPLRKRSEKRVLLTHWHARSNTDGPITGRVSAVAVNHCTHSDCMRNATSLAWCHFRMDFVPTQFTATVFHFPSLSPALSFPVSCLLLPSPSLSFPLLPLLRCARHNCLRMSRCWPPSRTSGLLCPHSPF